MKDKTGKQRIKKALKLIRRYGGIDGDHHKQWVLDQVVRRLTGKAYKRWVKAQKAGEDGPNTYDWEEGIAPLFDGVQDSVDMSSASLGAAFNAAAGIFSIWVAKQKTGEDDPDWDKGIAP